MREVAGIVPVLRDGRILLVSNSKGRYILPKGGVRRGEGTAAAAQREAYEEAGVRGSTAAEPAACVAGKTYFVMRVDTVDEAFAEAHKRTRLVLTPQDALARGDVPAYVKKVIRECLNRQMA